MDTSALQHVLDAITAVTADVCGWCNTVLPADAPSLDYCSEEHQGRWLAHQADVEPVPISQVFDELVADLLARLPSPPMLFTSTTPDSVSLRYRYMLERRLSYGVGLGINNQSALLRDINIA